MRKLIILLMVTILMLLPSCKTKQVTTSTLKEKQNLEQVVNNDSAVNISVKKNKYDFNESLKSSESIFQKLGLIYSGNSNEDKGSVKLNQTDKGFEVDISGAFKMNLDQSKEENKEMHKEIVKSLLDSMFDAKMKQNKLNRLGTLQESFEKDKVSKTTGFQFGAYLTGFGVVCFVLLLAWLGWRFKSKSKK